MNRRLPLGVDVGNTRIRIAELFLDRGMPEIHNVAVHEVDRVTDTDLPHQIRDLLRAADIKARNCVCGFAEPNATVRLTQFPPMSRAEQRKAAHFEAGRYVANVEDAIVSLTELDQAHRFALGIVDGAVLARRLKAIRAAGLRIVAADYDGFALKRTFPDADAILDVGYSAARFYAYGGPIPYGTVIEYGGRNFTNEIARAFAIGMGDAEQRKRLSGVEGIGGDTIPGFCRVVARAIQSATTAGFVKGKKLVLCGNGARLTGLADSIALDLGYDVQLANELMVSTTYPNDIVNANAPDWSLAVGLALYRVRREHTA